MVAVTDNHHTCAAPVVGRKKRDKIVKGVRGRKRREDLHRRGEGRKRGREKIVREGMGRERGKANREGVRGEKDG